MKKICLIRHAKSDHNLDLEDFDRPLSKKGENDAQIMAKALNERRIDCDLIITSGAKRALSTAQYIASGLAYSRNLQIDNRLYHGSEKEYIAIIHELDDRFNTVIIVGHNPIITETGGLLCGGDIHYFDPCAVLCASFKRQSFSLIDDRSGEVVFFDSPKLRKGQSRHNANQ
ncbi:MAG: histidine phosphatase family protein [Helicobacteraceae bacterium]|jgi:phosphohistidine phosphatase|nr:histidine phosphatase family protein [Helicobacteraceae bacterium]